MIHPHDTAWDTETLDLRADLRAAWIGPLTDRDDAIDWMASGRGPTPEEWCALCRLATDEWGDREAMREDARRCA